VSFGTKIIVIKEIVFLTDECNEKQKRFCDAD